MIADLHAHYPMRVVTDMTPETAAELMRAHGHDTLRDRIRALILRIANRLGNFPTWDGSYRVTPKTLSDGNVGLAMSVLFRPFAEMDLSKPYAAPPDPSYFGMLLDDLEAVEQEVAEHDPAQICLVHDLTELHSAIGKGATALVHAVEGGFHLGDTDDEIMQNCSVLAEKGVGYVTVAHLFFRRVATNANAIPFIPDSVYRILFPQCGRDRLTPRGEAVVKGLVKNHILIDLSHMDPPAIGETLDLLDTLDPAGEVPVISTHAGYRFGRQRYMHDRETLLRIKDRGGVVGLIMAQYQLNDGLRKTETETLEESLDVIGEHIRKIAEITGGFDQIALGTDFDGFVKPTMGGLTTMADLPDLEAGLTERYGEEATEQMMWKNALHVLEKPWRARMETR